MSMNQKQVIFIGGSSYSGSTMLDMMLANGQDGFSVGEVHALFHPYRPHHFNPNCGCGEPECDFWIKVREAGEDKLYETIFKLLPNISYIVDSSKNPWWITAQTHYLSKQSIQFFNILIWKNPANFAYSMLKRNRKGWKKAWVNYHRLYFTLIEQYIAIAYQDIVQSPSSTLKNLCEKVEIDYFPEKELFWKKRHHTIFGNDSAKIHLTDNTISTAYKKNMHKTIYNDKSYNTKIPTTIVNKIKTDHRINSITNTLLGESNLNDIVYGNMSLTFKYFIYFLKRIIGYSLGRSMRIF